MSRTANAPVPARNTISSVRAFRARGDIYWTFNCSSALSSMSTTWAGRLA